MVYSRLRLDIEPLAALACIEVVGASSGVVLNPMALIDSSAKDHIVEKAYFVDLPHLEEVPIDSGQALADRVGCGYPVRTFRYGVVEVVGGVKDRHEVRVDRIDVDRRKRIDDIGGARPREVLLFGGELGPPLLDPRGPVVL